MVRVLQPCAECRWHSQRPVVTTEAEQGEYHGKVKIIEFAAQKLFNFYILFVTYERA